MIPIILKFRSVFIPVTVLFVGVTLLGTFIDTRAKQTQSVRQVIEGEWEVTQLTGSITIEPVEPTHSWCEKGEVRVYPIIDGEETFIRFKKFNEEDLYWDEMAHWLEDKLGYAQEKPILIDWDKPKGSFIFQFSFDNGFYTNSLCEGQLYLYESLLEGLWSYAMGYIGEGVSTRGISGIIMGAESITGTKWGGKGEFKVFATLLSADRISGSWEWAENTAGPFPKMECRTTSKGSGTWVAIKN